ncbi:hypothetical protein FBU59_001421 [Linderina macrospora]|uniref:Uncharacterized protein n=1 Tax=Linderina macrospora TaxID=4868 RepID=A0ACC1JE19_9FUNG|nr:hypothetical protein FBU59_001421 [Linderina macrospora]
MSPSPTTSETPARSLEGTSVSGAFGPLQEESEEELSAMASKRQSRLHSDSAPPEHTTSARIAGEPQAEESKDDGGGAVHETHRMAVDYDPHTGRKMINQYMIIRELGRGTHGKVKLAFDTMSGEYYAIKIIDKESRDKRLRPNTVRTHQQRPAPYSADARHRRNRSSHGYLRIDIDKMEKVKREIAILKKCNHPNVVRLREVIDDAHARRIYLVIEYMDGGEIVWRDSDNLPVMSPSEARSVFRDLLLGVEYLHYVGILHRDLKPQNLLCNKQGKVKISDFGVSFLSRRMSKHNLKQANAKELPNKLETVAEQPSTTPAAPSVTVTSAADKARGLGPQVYNSLGKAASPLRPIGGTAAFQGSMLHRFASQPQMGSSLVLPSSSVLHRKGSAAFRGKGLVSDGASSSGASSISGSLLGREHTAGARARRGRQSRHQRPFSQSIRHKSTMGMTDEFGNVPTPPPQKVPALPSPVYKLPAELSSTDSNVYDPFDSSDSDEFFTSSDSESDYGEEFAEGEGQFRGNLDSDSDSEDGIVFGASKPKAQKDEEAEVPESEKPSSSKEGRHNEEEEDEDEPKGTLGDIKAEYSEEEEERELAKTAGTPAFFAPELCCTAEELTRLLKEDRARRHARDRLSSRDRSVTMPPLGTSVQCSSSTQPSEAGSLSKNEDEHSRPASCIVENIAAKPSSTAALGSPDSPRSPRMKRQSTIASLLTRPFSSRSSVASRPESASSSRSHSLRTDDAQVDVPIGIEDQSFVDEPLPPNVITPAIDIWAMGVTLYCLIYGRVPFKATTEFELFNIIPRKQIEFPEFLEVEQPESYDSFGGEPLSFGTAATQEHSSESQRKRIALPPVDPHLRDLLSRLLDKDFRTRITIEEIKKHPWVTKGLDRPTSWMKDTDPTKNPCVNITTQEVEQALVPKQHHSRRGFRASVKRRISMFSSKPPHHQQESGKTTKDKSSLDWLKIW